MDCGLLNARSKLAAKSVLARATSSSVGGEATTPWTVASAASSAAASESSLRTVASTNKTPGSPSWSANADAEAASPGATTFWYSRPAGSVLSRCVSTSTAANSSWDPAGTWYAAITSCTSPTRRKVTDRSPSCAGSAV